MTFNCSRTKPLTNLEECPSRFTEANTLLSCAGSTQSLHYLPWAGQGLLRALPVSQLLFEDSGKLLFAWHSDDMHQKVSVYGKMRDWFCILFLYQWFPYSHSRRKQSVLNQTSFQFPLRRDSQEKIITKQSATITWLLWFLVTLKLNLHWTSLAHFLTVSPFSFFFFPPVTWHKIWAKKFRIFFAFVFDWTKNKLIS